MRLVGISTEPMEFFKSPREKINVCQERLAYYYQKMNEYYRKDPSISEECEYIKERVSFWETEMLEAENDEYFKELNVSFNIE